MLAFVLRKIFLVIKQNQFTLQIRNWYICRAVANHDKFFCKFILIDYSLGEINHNLCFSGINGANACLDKRKVSCNTNVELDFF